MVLRMQLILQVGKGLKISAWDKAKEVGSAYYKVDPKWQGRTLHYLVNHAPANAKIGTKDTEKSSKGMPIKSKYFQAGQSPCIRLQLAPCAWACRI